MLRFSKYRDDIVMMDVVKDEFTIIENNNDGKYLFELASCLQDLINKHDLVTAGNYLVCNKNGENIAYRGFLEERWFTPHPDIKHPFGVYFISCFFGLKYCKSILEKQGFLGVLTDLNKVRTINIKKNTVKKNEIIDKYKACFEVIFPLVRKKSNCLLYSYFMAKKLIRQGIPAEVVVGVRTRPFYSHAWVEVEGDIITDDKEIRNKLSVILVI